MSTSTRRLAAAAAHLAPSPCAGIVDPPSATAGGDPPLLVTRVGPPMEGHGEGRVAIVQLNDPPMNLFSVRTVNAFERLLPTLADDFGVRCVVIRGGPKHFSGGANLLEMTTNRGVVQENFPNGTTYRGKYVPTEEAFIRQRMALVNMVEAVRFTLTLTLTLAVGPDPAHHRCCCAQFPKPVISSIVGACVGGGLELSLACHFRLAAVGCKIGLPEIERGFPPAWGGTVRLSVPTHRLRVRLGTKQSNGC